MAVFSSNNALGETIQLTSSDATSSQKFLKVDDSLLSGGLLKDDKYVATFVFSGNTAAYIKATFVGNLDRSGTEIILPVVSESNYEAATYEILNDSVEVEHLYNLDSEELQMFSTRTANSTHTTIELELRNLNDQTFYFTAYFEGYTYDTPVESFTSNSSNFLFGDRGVFGGGTNPNVTPPRTNTIDYISISTSGTNATEFGELTVGRTVPGATSDGSRGVFGGGYNGTDYTSTIDYIEIATPSDATVFGSLTGAGRGDLTATSDGSRGVFGGGYIETPTIGDTNTIDYITISIEGDNATDFGDLTQKRRNLAATSDGSRGVFSGGYSGPSSPKYVDTIDYITISTPSDATDFGDLTVGNYALSATSDGSRGVFGGGYFTPPVTIHTTIDYISISTPGDATVFGSLSQGRYVLAATSNGSRGVFGGGTAPGNVTTIDYITISTPGDATVFGSLSQGNARNGLAATSGN